MDPNESVSYEFFESLLQNVDSQQTMEQKLQAAEQKAKAMSTVVQQLMHENENLKKENKNLAKKLVASCEAAKDSISKKNEEIRELKRRVAALGGVSTSPDPTSAPTEHVKVENNNEDLGSTHKQSAPSCSEDLSVNSVSSDLLSVSNVKVEAEPSTDLPCEKATQSRQPLHRTESSPNKQSIISTTIQALKVPGSGNDNETTPMVIGSMDCVKAKPSTMSHSGESSSAKTDAGTLPATEQSGSTSKACSVPSQSDKLTNHIDNGVESCSLSLSAKRKHVDTEPCVEVPKKRRIQVTTLEYKDTSKASTSKSNKIIAMAVSHPGKVGEDRHGKPEHNGQEFRRRERSPLFKSASRRTSSANDFDKNKSNRGRSGEKKDSPRKAKSRSQDRTVSPRKERSSSREEKTSPREFKGRSHEGRSSQHGNKPSTPERKSSRTKQPERESSSHSKSSSQGSKSKETERESSSHSKSSSQGSKSKETERESSSHSKSSSQGSRSKETERESSSHSKSSSQDRKSKSNQSEREGKSYERKSSSRNQEKRTVTDLKGVDSVKKGSSQKSDRTDINKVVVLKDHMPGISEENEAKVGKAKIPSLLDLKLDFNPSRKANNVVGSVTDSRQENLDADVRRLKSYMSSQKKMEDANREIKNNIKSKPINSKEKENCTSVLLCAVASDGSKGKQTNVLVIQESVSSKMIKSKSGKIVDTNISESVVTTGGAALSNKVSCKQNPNSFSQSQHMDSGRLPKALTEDKVSAKYTPSDVSNQTAEKTRDHKSSLDLKIASSMMSHNSSSSEASKVSAPLGRYQSAESVGHQQEQSLGFSEVWESMSASAAATEDKGLSDSPTFELWDECDCSMQYDDIPLSVPMKECDTVAAEDQINLPVVTPVTADGDVEQKLLDTSREASEVTEGVQKEGTGGQNNTLRSPLSYQNVPPSAIDSILDFSQTSMLSNLPPTPAKVSVPADRGANVKDVDYCATVKAVVTETLCERDESLLSFSQESLLRDLPLTPLKTSDTSASTSNKDSSTSASSQSHDTSSENTEDHKVKAATEGSSNTSSINDSLASLVSNLPPTPKPQSAKSKLPVAKVPLSTSSNSQADLQHEAEVAARCISIREATEADVKRREENLAGEVTSPQSKLGSPPGIGEREEHMTSFTGSASSEEAVDVVMTEESPSSNRKFSPDQDAFNTDFSNSPSKFSSKAESFTSTPIKRPVSLGSDQQSIAMNEDANMDMVNGEEGMDVDDNSSPVLDLFISESDSLLCEGTSHGLPVTRLSEAGSPRKEASKSSLSSTRLTRSKGGVEPTTQSRESRSQVDVKQKAEGGGSSEEVSREDGELSGSEESKECDLNKMDLRNKIRERNTQNSDVGKTSMAKADTLVSTRSSSQKNNSPATHQASRDNRRPDRRSSNVDSRSSAHSMNRGKSHNTSSRSSASESSRGSSMRNGRHRTPPQRKWSPRHVYGRQSSERSSGRSSERSRSNSSQRERPDSQRRSYRDSRNKPGDSSGQRDRQRQARGRDSSPSSSSRRPRSRRNVSKSPVRGR